MGSVLAVSGLAVSGLAGAVFIGVIISEVSMPLIAARKSRRPRPSDRPTSGSRLGPSTKSATTSTNRRWVG